MPFKWGIVSVGRICNDFCQSFTDAVDKQGNELAAVAARDLDRAQEFAKRFNIKKAYGSYEEMAKDPDIDVAYIGTLHKFHLSTAKLFLDHGKPLLVEKPLCMTYEESKELLDYAKSKNLFVMEAIWSRFFPAVAFMRETLDQGGIGEVKFLSANMGFELPLRDEVKDPGDHAQHFLAVYVLHIPLMVFKGEPQEVQTATTRNEHGIINSIAYTLKYENGAMAQLYCSLDVCTDVELVIYGTQGKIEIPAYHWSPDEVIVNSKLHTFPLPDHKAEDYNFPRSGALFYEVPPVAECIQKGLLENPLMPHRDTLLMAKINDQLLEEK